MKAANHYAKVDVVTFTSLFSCEGYKNTIPCGDIHIVGHLLPVSHFFIKLISNSG